jgi:hypothetical protein
MASLKLISDGTSATTTLTDLNAIAASMQAGAEASTGVASMTNSEYVISLYSSMFGRTVAADSADVAYWTNDITLGNVTRANMIQTLILGAEASTGSATDAAVLANKTTVGLAYADAGLNGTFSVATITADTATVTAAQAEINTLPTGTTGSVLILTTGMDTLAGTANDDQFYAVIDETTTTNTTLQSFDTVNGENGADTLNLTLAGSTANGADYTGDANFESIEIVKVKATDATGDAQAFNADTLALTELTNYRSNTDLSLNNIEATTTSIGIEKVTTAGKTTTATFKDAGATSTNDNVSVVLTDTTAAHTVALVTSGSEFIENVTVDVTSASLTTLTAITAKDTTAGASGLQKLTVTGSGDLTITTAVDFNDAATVAGTGTLDAATATGDLTVTFEAGNITATGGTGNDTMNFVATLTAADTIDGGAGTDTVSIDDSALAANTGTTTKTLSDYAITNVEKVKVEAEDADALVIVTDQLAGLTTVIAVENNTTAKAITINDLAAGVNVILESNVTAQAIGAVTLGLEDASGTADAVTVTLKGIDTNAAETNTIDSLTVANIETLNIVSSYLGTLSSDALDAGDSNTITSVVADTKLTAVNASGSDALSFTMSGAETNLATINASAMTDVVTVDVGTNNLATAISITTGSEDDTITMGTTLNNADTINGGSNSTDSSNEDTLTATINGLTATTGALHIANVEVIELDTAGAASTINAAGITGFERLAFGSAQIVTITNLANNATIGLGVAASLDYTGELDVSLADATGTTDAITFEIADVAADNAVNAILDIAAAVETVTVNVKSDGDSADSATLDVTTMEASTLVLKTTLLSGGVAANLATDTLTLATLNVGTTTVNAADLDMILSMTASASATTITLDGGQINDVTGGAGNDTFTVETTAVNQNVDGGAGTDSLTMALGGTVVATNIANFETYNFTVDASTAGVFTVATGTGINDSDTTTVNVSGGNALSTLAIGGAMGATGASGNAIGIANGSEATGLTAINATNFLGAVTLTFGDDVLDTNLTVTGGAGEDVVNAAYTANHIAKLVNVETFNIQVDGTAAVDLSNITGMTRVNTDDDNTAAAITLTDLKDSVTVGMTTGAASGSLTVDMLNKTATNNTLTVEVTAIDTSATLTVEDVETLTLDVEGTASLSLAGLAMTDTAGTARSSLVVTGDSALTISALHADVTTIDASGMISGGSVVQTGRSATAASTYTGSDGADTFIMMNKDDAMNSGSGADTLDVNFVSVIGGLSVDLSSTTDQIATFNGASNSVIQLGFNNVDLSGYTGNGAEITAAATGSTIIGTASVDSITGGAIADTITGGAGADAISGGAGADIFTYAAYTDSYVSTTAAAPAGYDTVAVAAADIFNFAENIAVVEAATAASGVAKAATGTLFIGQLSTAYLAADDGVASIEAMVISFTGGEQFLVVDVDADQDITAADYAIQLTGTITGLTLAGANAVIA